jgi:hypothetical protein
MYSIGCNICDRDEDCKFHQEYCSCGRSILDISQGLKVHRRPCLEIAWKPSLQKHASNTQISALIKAMIRMAHGNPILGAAKRIIRGKITPPIPPAVQAMPVA